MKHHIINYKKWTSALLIAGIMCSCSNMSDGTLTRTQGTGIGLLGGGGIGAGIGGLIGGKKGVAIGAGIGGAIGGVLGYLWGDSVAKKKEECANTEEFIRANSKHLDNRIAQLSKKNDTLASEINTMKQRKQRLTANEAKQVKKELDADISLINADLIIARDAAREAKGSERVALNQKINTLVRERDELQSNKNKINTLVSR